jgi:LacI family transcriptional regulator
VDAVRSNTPTIKDVAKRAGVSFKTVSRVINGQGGVRDEVRARVREAIAELGYVVNYSARALASGRSHAIGVVIPSLTDPHSFHLIHHVGEVSERHKVGVVVLTRPTLSDELTLSSFIGHGLVGALMVVAPRSVEAYLPIIKALSIPMVVVESLWTDEAGQVLETPVPCVASDGRQGAQTATRHLLELGHRQIGLTSGSDSGQSHLRYLGYCDTLTSYDVPLRADYVRAGRWTWESGHAEASALLELAEPPTALFCANDNMALGAIRATTDRGLRVPEDVSVMGFDDIWAAPHSIPALTTIRQPAAEMVQIAVDLLVRGMRGEPIPATNHILPTTLVLRDSCAPPGQRQYS